MFSSNKLYESLVKLGMSLYVRNELVKCAERGKRAATVLAIKGVFNRKVK